VRLLERGDVLGLRVAGRPAARGGSRSASTAVARTWALLGELESVEGVLLAALASPQSQRGCGRRQQSANGIRGHGVPPLVSGFAALSSAETTAVDCISESVRHACCVSAGV